MQTDIEVSVLIPVYNAAHYLPACLDSVRKQTFTSIEIICVNDGSTDSSQDILEKYATGEPRLRVIKQPNCGVAVTRNRLLQEARGKYIAFVDADDVIKPDYLEKLVHKAHDTGADITKCFFQEMSEDGKQMSAARCSHLFYATPTADLFSRFECGYYDSVVWGKIFNLAWLRQTGILFFKNRIAEDLPFVVLAFMQANTIAVVPEILYFYRKGLSDCITSHSDRMIVDQLRNLIDLRQELCRRRLFEGSAVQGFWIKVMIWRICAFRKLLKSTQETNQELLKQAFSAVRLEVANSSLYFKIRWGLLFTCVDICGWRSVYFWTKIFR